MGTKQQQAIAEPDDQEFSIGGRVRELRKSRGFSAKKLAELSKISPSYLSLLERGERPWRSDHLSSVSRVLGVSVSELVQESETSIPRSQGIGQMQSVLDLLSKLPPEKLPAVEAMLRAMV